MIKDDEMAVAEAVVASPVVEAIAETGESHPLLQSEGLVIKQDRQLIECLLQDCCGFWCLEYDNRYEIAPTAKGTQFIQTTGGAGFKPSMDEINLMTKTLRNTEYSDVFIKCCLMLLGCGSCRPFKMYLSTPANLQQSFVNMEREFACGGILCCPHEAVIFTGGQPVARVIEDWTPSNYIVRLCEWCLLCRVPYNIQLSQNGQYTNRYRINVNHCCCGPHCNFCGSTPCFNDQLWDVAVYENGGGVNKNNVAGRVQRTYGTCANLEAFLRCYCCNVQNYVLQWNEDTTVEERAAILGATTLFDYVFFERKGSPFLYMLLAISGSSC